MIGLFADGRKDQTLVIMKDDESGKFHKRVVQEEHITVTEEPKGTYITHFTPEEADKTAKPAYQQAKGLYEFLVDHRIDESLLLVIGDTTNSMTGAKGGLWAHLEEMLGRPLFLSLCSLHINELPLRHLMTALDGPTTSDKGWSGPIGKLLSNVNTMSRLREFEPIKELEPMVQLTEKVVKGLSTDSQLAYRLTQTIVKGKMDVDLINRLVGNLSHARWLTTAEAILLLYMSDHGLDDKQYETLSLLSKWIVQVYFHQFFNIKAQPGIVKGPYHLLTLLRLFREQDHRVKEILVPYIKSEAWWAHPEPLLLSLLCSDSQADREFAIEKIKKCRKGRPISKRKKKRVRERRVPQSVNLQAETLVALIDWSQESISEPSFTIKLSLGEIESFKDVKMSPPNFYCHSQSCERAVKAVTEAAAKVCGWERRDRYVRVTMASRDLIPVFNSKKDILTIFSQ